MDEWEKIHRHYKKMEILGILAIMLCFVIGIVCDWNVIYKNNVLIPIEDIDAFSLTILQIQAAVGTLVIAIIALITGNISDSYMGISISDFYLNIKPWKLTQKIWILILLGLSLAGVIFHSLGLYNMVFYAFISTIMGIMISIMEIYSAFKGRNKQNHEIEAYINYVIETNMAFNHKLNVYRDFVSDWKKEIESQDKQSYDDYLQIFREFIVALSNYETDESLVAVEQQCFSIAYCLLGSEKTTLKERGIEFVQDIYDTMWSIIHGRIMNDKILLNRYKSEFPLFSEISNELIQSIEELNIENVEKRIKLGNLIDSIQRVAIWFRYDEDKNAANTLKGRRYEYNFSSEMSELNFFARFIGFYLQRQQNRNNIINREFWGDVLSRWGIFSTYNVPEERTEDFLKSKVMTYFCYCYGMLTNGQENIVKNGLYLKGIKRAVKLDNKYQVLLYLSVHCYVYYLAIRESEECVTEKIRKSANDIWNDVKVKDAFLDLLNMLAENPEWLDVDMHNQMTAILTKFELYPQYEPAKRMILEFVITDFYTFIVLFMSHEFYLPELLERNIDDMKAFRYVSDGMGSATKEMLFILFKNVFLGNKTDEQVQVEVNLMYDELEKIVKKKQKERYIKLAKQAQDDYIRKINEKEICKKIKNETLKSIKDRFAPILVDEDVKNGIIKINLLNLFDYTSSIGEKNSTTGHYSHMYGMLLLGIEKFLYKRRVVEVKNRFEDFANDKEFMDYLSDNNIHLLLGSQHILKNRDYKISSEYKKILENYETIYTSVLNEGIVLKRNAVKICLHDINVSIHSPSIREENVEYDKTTGKYNYSILNGLPIDFDENELREFLYNNRKVLNVTAKISIQINQKPVGTILTGNRDKII